MIAFLIILPLAIFFISFSFWPLLHFTGNLHTGVIVQVGFYTAYLELQCGHNYLANPVSQSADRNADRRRTCYFRVSFQGMFRNPLISPDILGVSSATGFGACLGMLISANSLTIQVFAVGFGILGVTLTYFLSRVYKTTPVLMLVLAGVVIGSIFSSGISIIKFTADPYSKLPAITFWLMGGLGTASWGEVLKVGIPVLIGSSVLMLLSWRINILSLGDEGGPDPGELIPSP